ncbi:hypothetical protein [Duganella callida]|uniref:Uncharacterized protein n=1 Tax=Duganella callida TaxID=2561932 RepID=A0A4Y9S7D2_9BURK|nr:hypothetical protein [Duganella callida]TFW15947.1 hypothetical protein E4L98_24950 [Duganella callida]
MRDYSKVGPQFWNGRTGKALKAKGSEAVIVGMYLMTCQHANMLGLYYLNKAYIAVDTGLGLEGASKGLQWACEVGFCSYDEASEVVWVTEMALYQIGEQLELKDNRCKGVQREYDSVPENPFLSAFYERYAKVFHMTNRRVPEVESTSPLQAPSKPLPSQEQEQEQEQEKNNTSAKTAAAAPLTSECREDGSTERRQKRRGTPEDETCARWLFGRILASNPEHKPPNFSTWADEVRLMRERDGRTHRAICELFDWAQGDSFWRANVLSPAKLREKWDQLTIKRGTPQKGQKHDNFATQDYRAGVAPDGSF